MSIQKAHIDEIFSQSVNKSTPVLLKFQNGDLKNANKETTLYFPAIYQSDRKRKHAVVVTSGNVYAGAVSDGSQELVDTYICIRNKTTNKVRILPIDQVKLINHVYEDKKKAQFNALSGDLARDTIIRNFGGRKDLRFLKNRQHDVSIDALRSQLETSVQNSEVTEAQVQDPTTESIIDSIRPKFDKDATNVASVYNVYDVIPLDLINRLDEEVAALMNTDLEDIPIMSEFLLKLIEKLKNGIKSSQTLLKMKMILYMDGLLKLIHSKELSLNLLELSKITEKVENDIRERFRNPKAFGKACRSNYTNEKALCYFLVLALLLTDDFELDINMLSKELRMSKTNILKYGHLLNAGLKRNTNVLELKLPCNVKPVNLLQRNRKRK